MEGMYVINLSSFLLLVIHESIRLRLDVHIILFRRYLNIERSLMVIDLTEFL